MLKLPSINKKTPKCVYAGCIGVSKDYGYVEWQRKAEQCINNKCVQERRRCFVRTNTLEDELHTCRGSFAAQNKTYINITTIYVKSMGLFPKICIPFANVLNSYNVSYFQ